MLHDTQWKAEHSVLKTLYQQFLPLCTRHLFVVNTLTVFLSFCYSECELFTVFINKDFVWQLKAFLPFFCHLCACEMSPGWGHLITWMDPSAGHLNGTLARIGRNLNNNFRKSQMSGGCTGGCPGGCWSFDLCFHCVTVKTLYTEGVPLLSKMVY